MPFVPTQMTFGVSRDHGDFEWSGQAEGIFAQRENVYSLRMWRMIFDIVRFNQFALDVLGDDIPAANGHADVKVSDVKKQMSIGEYLEREGYSQAFKDDYLIPMTAAVWSTSPDKASLDFPAVTLIRFMWNHHLLSTISARPTWYTIPGGSQKYIDAILAKGKIQVNTSSRVTEIIRSKSGGKHQVKTADGVARSFDHIIVATHGDEILPLLKPSQSQTPLEEEILSSFTTTENTCYLHSDLTFMPKRRAVWTAWNYLISSHPSASKHPAGVSLTYWMNNLQHIPEHVYGPVLVTMNPEHPPAPSKTQGKFVYTHPLYTVEAVAAQERMHEIQGTHGISYVGAWTKYGFHEDGFSSGVKAAMDLGATLPFEFVDSTYSRGRKPVMGVRSRVIRAMVLLIHAIIGWGEWFKSWPVVFWLLAVLAEAHDTLMEIIEGERGNWRCKLD